MYNLCESGELDSSRRGHRISLLIMILMTWICIVFCLISEGTGCNIRSFETFPKYTFQNISELRHACNHETGMIMLSIHNVPCQRSCCPLHLHVNCSSEYSPLWVIDSVIVNKEFSFLLPWVYKSPIAILDAGANIGAVTLFFAIFFPEATIIALEPTRTNYKTLLLNTAIYPNVHVFPVALWNTSTWLIPKADPGQKGHDMYQETSAGHPAVPTTTIPRLLKRFNLSHFDIVKLDIEGAEAAVFNSDLSWLPRCSALTVEIHDFLMPDPGLQYLKQLVENSFRGLPFNLSLHGELSVYRRFLEPLSQNGRVF